jgi:PQQ-dependent catabolism-associated beta-propeller protein
MKTFLSVIVVFILTLASAYADMTGRIFVTNERSDSISVIDSKTNQIETTVEVGKRPRGIGFSPDHSELYVAVSDENAIAVVDPKTLQVLRKFEAGSDPETFAVHPNGNIYISNEDDAKATVINPKTGEHLAEIKVGLEPEGVAVSPDGSKVIILSESTNMLHVISIPDHKITDNILVGARPRSVTFSQNGELAYTAAEISGEVFKIDIVNAKIIQKGTFENKNAKPKDVLLSKDEKTLYIAGGRANKVMVMDTESLSLIKGIPVGKRVWGLVLSRDGSRLYTTDGVSGTVSVIDTDKNKVIETIKVGEFPWGVVIDD